MRIAILGSAAGGGFPQWNCNCQNCQRLRAGDFRGKPRTQTQVAVSDDGRTWFLLNASPDLRLQIERTPVLQPRSGLRDSPIAGVLITSADIDQVAGLLSLRELQPFRIYSTPSLRQILREDNSMFGMLNRVPEQVCWMDILMAGELPAAHHDGRGVGNLLPGIFAGQEVSCLRFAAACCRTQAGGSFAGRDVDRSFGRAGCLHAGGSGHHRVRCCGFWKPLTCCCSTEPFGAMTN